MNQLLKDFYGVPTGEIYPRTIAAGDVCPDNLVIAAREAGALPSDDDGTAKDGDQNDAPDNQQLSGENQTDGGAQKDGSIEPASNKKKTNRNTAAK